MKMAVSFRQIPRDFSKFERNFNNFNKEWFIFTMGITNKELFIVALITKCCSL